MRRRLPTIFPIFLTLALLAPAHLSGQTLGGRFLDSAVDSLAWEHLSSGQVAGLTVAVARGGDLLHLQGYGHADIELDVAMPLDAVYEIGSVTKQFTAVLTLMLAEEGLLDLDADISEYPPSFDTGGRSLPLRRLLDHTSGMKGYTETAVFGALATQALPQDTLLRLMEQEPWDFEPGQGLIYNNTAYFLLGRILEEVSGSAYAELLEERILTPMGMENTHYCDPSRVVPDRANGYQAAPDGLIRAPYLDHRWPFAAGSMCSTARDLIRWNEALHGGQVLAAESYEALITPEPLADGSEVFYAKGLVHQDDDYGEVIAHGGGIFGFLTDVRYYPEDDLTLVVIQNTAGPVGPGEVMEGLASLLLPVRESVVQDTPFPGDLSLLAGTYLGPSRGRALEVEVRAEGDALFSRSNDGEEVRLTHVGDGRFEGLDGSRVWFVSADGRPVGSSPPGPPSGMRFGAGGLGLFPLTRQGG